MDRAVVSPTGALHQRRRDVRESAMELVGDLDHANGELTLRTSTRRMRRWSTTSSPTPAGLHLDDLDAELAYALVWTGHEDDDGLPAAIHRGSL